MSSIAIDHMAIPSRDPEGAARFLAAIVGLPEDSVGNDGPHGGMVSMRLEDGSSLLFVEVSLAAHHHVALRVPGAKFAAVVERLQHAGVPFGNDPEHPDNGESWDPLGGNGRVYFASADGHLFEVRARSSS